VIDLNFTGKIVLVTGASRGIGRGIAKLFSEAGAKVALTYANNEEAALSAISELQGSGHKAYKLNSESPDSIEATFNAVNTEMGGLHVLINNAGITKDQLLLRMKTDDWDQVLTTNLRGVFLSTKAAVKLMLKAREGSIINIASVIGQTGNAGQSSYAASKAGIIAFTKSIALEVASRQIRLNCIAPGFIKSDMTDSLTDEQKKGILERVPLGSIGETVDVASACLFLASPLARYITGHTLNVNGGLYMNS
jgi:3-oxoacyl-[acyl-carrier protein] reductase